MTEKNKLITLTNSEKGWLVIGVLFGFIIAFLSLWICTILPSINYTQQVGISCFIGGMGIMYLLSQLEWE